MEDIKQVRLTIFGRVQGVFFRASAKEKAHMLSITGWAKNLPNGSVEVVAQGGEEALLKFIEWCHKGSERADVENVVVTAQEVTRTYSEFSIGV